MDDYLLRHLIFDRPEERKPRRYRGQFYKGETPHNKGVSWDGWLPKEKQEKIREMLRSTRRNGNPDWVKGCKAHNAVEVVVFRDGKKVGIYRSASEAARELGLNDRNVRYCVEGKRHSCGGYVFFRREDTEKWLTVMSTHCDVPPGYHKTENGRIFPYRKKK